MRRIEWLILLWSLWATLLVALSLCLNLTHAERKGNVCGALMVAVIVLGYILIFNTHSRD